ncbi:MAG: peptidyl-prolyl cis-trans isomerase [Gammaproteobacteria bacterium]|nr:MAG: peptidyl-prolyl cis-trans isomerase [Gammaproteobacteria bacterium]RLA22431.1 MAG: peptidyl-prolyl cis-trans isomerase [Gammaproteobacteria bacterium]
MHKLVNRFYLLSFVLLFSVSSVAENKSMTNKSDSPVKIELQTTLGNVVIELDTVNAPISSENFIQYVQDGFYNGTIFHRVIPGFMAQGGGFTEDFVQKDTRENIQNEANNGIKNDRGTVAMARTPAPHSASSQFFINYGDNGFLNFSSETSQGWGYAVFGKVVEGMDIVDKMAEVPTGSGGPMPTDVPQTPIVIEKAVVVE